MQWNNYIYRECERVLLYLFVVLYQSFVEGVIVKEWDWAEVVVSIVQVYDMSAHDVKVYSESPHIPHIYGQIKIGEIPTIANPTQSGLGGQVEQTKTKHRENRHTF